MEDISAQFVAMMMERLHVVESDIASLKSEAKERDDMLKQASTESRVTTNVGDVCIKQNRFGVHGSTDQFVTTPFLVRILKRTDRDIYGLVMNASRNEGSAKWWNTEDFESTHCKLVPYDARLLYDSKYDDK